MTSSNYLQNETKKSTAMDGLMAMFNVTEVDSFLSLRTTPGVSSNSRRESRKERPDGWFSFGEYGYDYEKYGYGYEEYIYGDDGIGYEVDLDRNSLARVILVGLIVLAGIFGNILVLVVIAAVRSMHTTVNFCLFSLGLADLLLLVTRSPYTMVSAITPHLSILGRAYCILYSSCYRGLEICSILSALYVTVDRYIALCYPFYPRRFSSGKKVYVILAAIWAVAVVLTSPHLYVAVTSKTRNCTSTFGDRWFGWYDIALTILFSFIPLPILIILSAKMAYALSRKVPSENDNGKAGETAGRRGRNQVMIMLLAVVIIFALCQFPFSISSFLANTFSDLDTRTMTKFVHASVILTFFNSAINPILYFSLSSKFRRAFKELLTTCRKQRSA